MLVAIETTESVESGDAIEACLELLSTNTFSSYPAIVLLMDLNKVWQSFWLDYLHIVSCVLNLPEGIALLGTVLIHFITKLLLPQLLTRHRTAIDTSFESQLRQTA